MANEKIIAGALGAVTAIAGGVAAPSPDTRAQTYQNQNNKSPYEQAKRLYTEEIQAMLTKATREEELKREVARRLEELPRYLPKKILPS